MGKLSTHVLDITRGKPAQGVYIELFLLTFKGRELLKSVTTNKDGRCDELLLDSTTIKAANYELLFYIGDYFMQNNKLISTVFLSEIPVRFYIADKTQNYHVPLLVSPWSYSVYRGS